MATSSLTFSDWQLKTNASLMSAAEELLEKLEDTSDLLSEIDEKYVMTEHEEADDNKTSIIQRFHAGLDSARNLVNVLKREKWRLNKREMSVELRMGELEDYKKHLKNDMSSLNQTVDALSMRVVQLENQRVEAQEIQENLEAELQEHRSSLHDANDKNIQLFTENERLKKTVKEFSNNNVQKENRMLKDEITMLKGENSKLKDLIREGEERPSLSVPKKDTSKATANGSLAKDDNLSKLTREFLDELSSLEERGAKSSAANVGASVTKSPTVNVQAEI